MTGVEIHLDLVRDGICVCLFLTLAFTYWVLEMVNLPTPPCWVGQSNLVEMIHETMVKGALSTVYSTNILSFLEDFLVVSLVRYWDIMLGNDPEAMWLFTGLWGCYYNGHHAIIFGNVSMAERLRAFQTRTTEVGDTFQISIHVDSKSHACQCVSSTWLSRLRSP